MGSYANDGCQAQPPCRVEADEVCVTAHKHIDGSYLCELELSDAHAHVLQDQKQDQQAASTDQGPHFVIILDRSGSMGDEVNRLIRQHLPDVLERLGCTKATVITFDSDSETFEMTVPEMRASHIQRQGMTRFQPGLQRLAAVLEGSVSKRFRILTVSDGIMIDCGAAASYASSIAASVVKDKMINSQAVRYFTSSDQPDTRGLSAVLQFNTTSKVKLIDFHARADKTEFVDLVVGVFENDGLSESPIMLQCPQPLLQRTPWSEPSAALTLTFKATNSSNSGSNSNGDGHGPEDSKNSGKTASFWLRDLPCYKDGDRGDDGDAEAARTRMCEQLSLVGWPSVRVVVRMGAPITAETFDSMMEPTLDQAMNFTRVLKVLDTAEAQEQVQRIASYFTDQRMRLAAAQAETEAGDGAEAYKPSTMARLRALQRSINQRHKSLLHRLLELANDERVSQLNAAQQAAYLRETTTSKNSRGLVRRAAKGPTGDELAATVRVEIGAIVTNIAELKDVDDSNHALSFISQETTLGSLRDLAQFLAPATDTGSGGEDGEDAEQSMLDNMTVPEMLRIVGIVGMACRGQVGDYPDPMTWRAAAIYPGCFITVADITEHELFAVTQQTSYGAGGYHDDDDVFDGARDPDAHNRLGVPGQGTRGNAYITNAIPVFEDVRIHHFLRRHAPTLLELVAGIGMRRMVASVPMTHAFTLAAGAWASVELLARTPPKERPEVLIRACAATMRDLDTAFGNYFQHVFPFMTQQQAEDRSFYLCNNGLTNMLTVLYRAERKQWAYPRQRVLRAIYNYECYQMTKKNIARHTEDRQTFIDSTLAALLQLEYDRDCCSVGRPFEPTPEFACAYKKLRVDSSVLAPFKRMFGFVEAMVLLPPLLRIIQQHNNRHQRGSAKKASQADGTTEKRSGHGAGERPKSAKQGPGVGDEGDGEKQQQGQQQGQQHLADNGDGYSDADLVAAVRALPALDTELLRRGFGLEDTGLDLDEFRALQLAMALLYPRKELRVDDEKEQMRVPDISTQAQASVFVLREVVDRLYRREYNKRVEAKQVAENAEATGALVGALLASDTREEFARLMREGLTHRGMHVFIPNPNADGASDLLEGVSDMKRSVPCRLTKIKLLVLGVDDAVTAKGGETDGEADSGDSAAVVWNRGNVLRLDLAGLAQAYTKEGDAEAWAAIRAEHKGRRMHVYRASANRHGHSNEKPSFWALGYKTMEEMQACVSREEFQEYRALHTSCCGFVDAAVS